MPLDLGISALLADEYDRFTTGLDALSDGGQRMARATAARRRARDINTREIVIPGWDDIFHVVPQPAITPAMREAHYAAIRAGQPSPLSGDLQATIADRSRRARLMNNAASPDYARAWGMVMTAIDNVQDLMTTIVTVGRLGLNPAIRGFEALAASRVALIGLAGHTGAAVGMRALPILGWVLLGADLLKLLQQLGLVAFPFYSLLCGGPRAALAAGVPAAVMGRALKLRAGGLAALNPFGRRARLSRSRAIRDWRPSIYNMMEVAQTTDALFGVGVSFGGLVGLMQDAAFGAAQRAQGTSVHVSTDRVADSFARVYSGRIAREGRAALHDLRTSANVLATAPVMNQVQEVFTVEEHLEALCMQVAAWDILRPYIEAPETVEALNLALDVEWEPPGYLQEQTRALLSAEGLPDEGYDTWPLAGNPRTISGAAYMRQAIPRIPAALAELLAPRRDEPTAGFIGALVDRINSHAAYQLTGSLDGVEYELLPLYQVLESLAMAHRWPAVEDDPGPALAFFSACEARMRQLGTRSLGPFELDQLAELTDLALIRALPIDAPFPPALFRA